jgi:hypothetical protein
MLEIEPTVTKGKLGNVITVIQENKDYISWSQHLVTQSFDSRKNIKLSFDYH